MVFCNIDRLKYLDKLGSHNPYFNRWFSAIREDNRSSSWDNCHNPYFNRWFSAIEKIGTAKYLRKHCHNPYFNRWFSAILIPVIVQKQLNKSQSLF